MGDIGGPELIIILVVVLVLFGGSQLPKLARNLGQAQREFKNGIDEHDAEPVAATAKAAPNYVPPAADAAAVCPCGSGKQFKDCHGAVDHATDRT